MSNRLSVHLSVNQVPQQVACDAGSTLLDVLRDDLGLTGTKFGCGIGYCGACTVLVDGDATHSCCVLAGVVDGREITTIEAVGDGLPGPSLDDVRQAFLEAGAVQCGYCSPGFVISVRALLAEYPNPTEAEVRDYLVGNICRCTGYAGIVRAALLAADRFSDPSRGTAGSSDG